MPRIIIESVGLAPPVRVQVIDDTAAAGCLRLVCTGDGRDECPPVGFIPGDTWGYSFEDCVQSAVIHVSAHERRVAS